MGRVAVPTTQEEHFSRSRTGVMLSRPLSAVVACLVCSGLYYLRVEWVAVLVDKPPLSTEYFYLVFCFLCIEDHSLMLGTFSNTDIESHMARLC